MSALLLPRLQRWQRTAWKVGAIGLVAWIIGAVLTHTVAFQSYWFAWIFWSGIGFGALSILLLHFLSGGAWGDAVRPSAEAAAQTIPLMALLMIPVFFAMSGVFPWAATHGLTELSPHKRAYLQVPWFIVRAAGYFVILGGLAYFLRRGAHDPARGSATAWSGGGIVAYAICMLFASTDWVVSLEPRWFSTMLLVIVMAWQFLAALALSVVGVTAFAPAGSVTPKQFHDLGNLLLAFVTFWIYISFSQFLIIWSGNLPREISWYLSRSAGGWQYMALALAVLQFGLPFALLLSRAAKRHPQRLLPIAALILLASVLNVFWLIVPSFRPTGFRVHWLDAAAFFGVGGIWVGAFLGFSKERLFQPMLATQEVARG